MSAEPISLTEDELFELTGYKRARFQRRYFDALGIPASPRADGTLCVVRAHLLNWRAAQNDEPKRVRNVRKVA